MAEPPSSPPGEAATPEDALTWYKTQYELLEAELGEFRESSKELELELEKDIERAEKQERVLREKAESVGFEVEEWKRKYKESKNEASAAQGLLEKEITKLRDTSRTLQLKLRDIEVANDDFERQARNTTSSLEDMESKYNQAIERAVMMEEEIKMGEQEREQLRIESQRLREELADLKIEAELLQDKIKKQESRHLSAISTDISVLESPTFDKTLDASPGSTASSPLVTTPPDTKSLRSADTVSELRDPPSPPMSDASRLCPSCQPRTRLRIWLADQDHDCHLWIITLPLSREQNNHPLQEPGPQEAVSRQAEHFGRPRTAPPALARSRIRYPRPTPSPTFGLSRPDAASGGSGAVSTIQASWADTHTASRLSSVIGLWNRGL
ncbi:hypothetical protein G7046_g6780 [Stylonectria norvegica]|nr:hypothetical protein G7046_g6780 [Stylonectria norvegica]